ncbi:MAG: DNA replication/repair protein RecF [Bradymonadia bacterium]
MHLTRITLQDFRNLSQVELQAHERFNVLVGENGQGKTNLLEAIYWLATLRPLRANRLVELIRWGSDLARVRGFVDVDGLEHSLEVRCNRGERTALREGKKCGHSDFFGVLSVVLFTPEDVGLVRGSPGDRRKFLDRAIFTGRSAYLSEVQGYRRALAGRNALLRQEAEDYALEAYEMTLARHGAKLMAARRAYVSDLSPLFEEAFVAIAGAGLKSKIKYRPSVSAQSEDDESALLKLWQGEREKDRQRGHTLHGPHSDDLAIELTGRSARAYASQGQQRAIVLALKIAEIRLLTALRGVTPVLLLDDVSSELDPQRNARLFEFLNAFEGQVFITTTDPSFLKLDAEHRQFNVHEGAIEVDRPDHQES